jgi:hypothetical protein
VSLSPAKHRPVAPSWPIGWAEHNLDRKGDNCARSTGVGWQADGGRATESAFQTVETINESRATRQRDEGALDFGSPTDTSERNLLVWGDNQLVMGSLLKQYAGNIKLIYIDPPSTPVPTSLCTSRWAMRPSPSCHQSSRSTLIVIRGAVARRPISRCSTSAWCSYTSFCRRMARCTSTVLPTSVMGPPGSVHVCLWAVNSCGQLRSSSQLTSLRSLLVADQTKLDMSGPTVVRTGEWAGS